MATDVFISYKSEDRKYADWVKKNLEAVGLTCWIAPDSIPGGTHYAEVISQGIDGCRYFIVILSENTKHSKFVPRELDRAINHDKVVLPFYMENCTVKGDMDFYLANIQHYQAHEHPDEALRQLISDVKGGDADVKISFSDFFAQPSASPQEQAELNKTFDAAQESPVYVQCNKLRVLGIVNICLSFFIPVLPWFLGIYIIKKANDISKCAQEVNDVFLLEKAKAAKTLGLIAFIIGCIYIAIMAGELAAALIYLKESA